MALIISTFLCTIASSITYRMGGSKHYSKLWRRIGCMLIATAWLLINITGVNLIALFISMGLMFGALSTYNDWLAPDGSSENWACWLMTGACYSLALLPLAITGDISWLGLSLRTIILSLAVMAVSELSSDDLVEECGRGGLFICTLPLILIG